MGHTPYGYRIENGQAVLDEAAASVIRKLYENYLSGMGLTNAARKSGLTTYHGTAKRILQNKYYLGDNFYPTIIEKETFDVVSAELVKRATQLGRLDKVKATVLKPIPTSFTMKHPGKELPNPLRQAKYLYSLIERWVT